MAQTEDQKAERLLILCVDRDNDIGRKANVRTPIVGRRDNMESAQKLILADPEEADANAMFEAVRIYDNLEQDRTSHDVHEIATIAGSELGGIAADRKLVSELSNVLSEFQADGLILVTDGYSDEDIMPLVQSRVPVTSVRRVVVKHSESLEETAAVFSRYWKMIIEDPRYSRIVLGIPGVLFIALGILVFLTVFIQFNIYIWATIVVLVIMGSYLLGKGYGLDRKLSALFSRPYHYTVSGLVTSFSMIAGVLLVAVGLYQAWAYISASYTISFEFPVDVGKLLEILPQVTGWFIAKSLTMIIIGLCVSLAGRSVGYVLDRDSRFWRTTALVVICAWSWTIFNEISLIIINPEQSPESLILSTIVGIVVIVASGLSTHFLGKKFQHVFKDKQEEQEETKDEPAKAKDS
jgi:putative membrane protein